MPQSTWVEVSDDSPFPVQNLPYGVFSQDGEPPRVGVAIGDQVLDLAPLAADSPLAALAGVFAAPTLGPFLALGPTGWRQARAWVGELLTGQAHRDRVRPYLVPQARVRLHLPIEVADYVDFYSSEHHARNLGRLFRPGSDPLTPNWRHLPIGYHGRAGTVVVSGTEIVRPCGQRRSADPGQPPAFGPSQRLDIEAEVGFVVGVPSKMGSPLPVDAFRDHVFGACLVNDWSARDIQAFEYVPLGPFLGKSFATSLSPWIVPLAALEEAWVPPPPRDPAPLAYLSGKQDLGLDLTLEVRLNGHVVSRPPFAEMYWTPAQQLAHLTVNGASVRTGDLFASGTVSGPRRDQCGSLIELAWGGKDPLVLPDGSRRVFLEDGDEVVISASAPGADGTRIGFGEVRGRIAPARC